ncbi:hypothetical protein SAY86_022671 [Trapa natans]|uniref:DNA-binding protein BIN4 n=1 Tax=Trapa natans TaxID=22666 RepID=A0AAN7LTB9_TRANT|nr:hypothetical protein SAY86_022671 [Trapa natans]
MSSSREQSPDWLRSFQAPIHSVPTVSLDQDHFLSDNSSEEEDDVDCDKLPISKILRLSNKHTDQGEKKVAKTDFQGSVEKEAQKFLAYEISSDSELYPMSDAKNKHNICLEETSECKVSQSQNTVKVEDGCFPGTGGDSSPQKISRRKYLKCPPKIEDAEQETDIEEKNVSGAPMDIAEEEMAVHHKTHAASSRLPLVLSEKVHRTKALVECEGDSIDLSGDMGAVGRVLISDTPSGNNEIYLDLKGTIYKTTIIPCRTFCVVSFGQSEAKIEAIMSDYMQLNPQSEFNEAETVVEGTLEGFSLDLDDEADGMPKPFPHQGDENDANGEKTNGKTKKKADKVSGLPQKRGRKAGSKAEATVKVRKKTRVSKKPSIKK